MEPTGKIGRTSWTLGGRTDPRQNICNVLIWKEE